ncbi:hypothetical protein PS687_04929 [Pseudomonas fluorescens]|nr:hypothetical protein PS687_04929 [Pseudomonas fluorescens]
MAHVTPPYFFDEFLRPVRRKTPTERERALGFTVKDLDWLHTLYYASDTARQNSTVVDHPMRVERLLLNRPGHPAITLAGAFMISSTPDDNKAVLYTPYGGLEVFDSRVDLLAQVQERLKQSSQRIDLLQFLAIRERHALPITVSLTVTSAIIQGAVMQDQHDALLAAQQQNVAMMLDELRKLPSLHGMLDTLLGIMSHSYFPGLNQADTRVNFFSHASADEDSRWVASDPLRDVLLRFYVDQAWPTDQTHTFFNIKHDTRAFSKEQLAQDQQRWDSVVEQTSGILAKLLSSLLQTYWNEDIKDGESRLRLFAQAMSDKFRVDLLLKHQNAILSTEENQTLQAVFLPDQAARSKFSSQLRVEKVQVHAPYQHYVELASTLMMSNGHAYLYTQTRGLQVLKDLNDLNATLLAMLKATGHEDELLNFLSLDERNLFIGMSQVQVTGRPVAGNVFQDMLEGIVAKQLDNLAYALGLYRRSASEIDLAALLDHALDVRTMLDSRLLGLDAGGRWTVHPVAQGNGRPTTVRAEKAKRQLQTLQAIDEAMALERSKYTTLSELAGHALEVELIKHQLDLKAAEVFINRYASAAQEREERLPLTSTGMVAHFIKRVAQKAGALAGSPRTWFYGPRRDGAAHQLHNLTIESFNAVIEQAMSTFTQHDLRELPHLQLENNQAHLSHGMLQGLRGETELSRLYKSLSPGNLDLLTSVLNIDSLRSREYRHGLNGFLPDAFGLTLNVDDSAEPQGLANCFVLTERGGIDPHHSGAALLWTPRHGFEAFTSIKGLRDALEQRLQDPLKRLYLIENLPVSRRVPHQRYRLGPLQRIDDHVLNNRQRTYSDLVREEIDHLLSMNLGAHRFQECMDALIRRAPPSNLPRAIGMARAMVHQQELPVWLGIARPDEQILHAELLEQYRLSAPDERDYLHSITPLREHAMSSLTTLLDARFPGQAISPDNILIAGRIDLEGNTQTLTDFALKHLPDLRAETIRPRSRTATPLPDALDGSAIEQLVRQLDLKSHYQAQLTTHLKGESEDTRKRRHLFYRQLPWQVLQYAHELKLDERLSASAWGFIQQVFDMPDGLARAAVRGVTAIIRPLELIATAGAVKAKALGCYLIGPKAGASGPLVLYAPYSAKHLLKEYANEAAFLNEFTTPGALQEWVVGQLQAPLQATYRNLLRQSWGPGPSDIHLGASTITGNLLNQLFNDNTEMLFQMLDRQFTTSGETQWDAITSLLTQGIPKILQLLPGKLAYPLVVWRSYKLFLTAAEELQQHHWQGALRAFVAGVAELASLRQPLDTLFPPPPVQETTTLEQWLQAPPPAPATLAELDLTAPGRTQLQAFEEREVALVDLEKSVKTHVYSNKSSTAHYVPLAGKVYPVKKAGPHWRLGDAGQPGPYIQSNAQGEWTLDLDQHHPRYGKTLSRYAGSFSVNRALREVINIEAVGIRAIAALSSWKAQCIDEALNVATYYAVNCKRNLVQFAPLRSAGSRVGRFFSELFGIVTLTPEQLQRVERRVDEVLDELTNHTLIGPDSMRFVSGTHRTDPRNNFAFVLPDDPDHKIYLLDRFFDPPMDIYQNRLTTPFNLSAHARATTLIHEITHIKSLTEDLAYLDTMRPFTDLINVNISGARLLKTELTDLRENALSVSTPVSMLFKTWDAFSQKWEDFGNEYSTSFIKDKVLVTTGAKTLEDARSQFMSNSDKRIDTILANADSVTYLISELGRVLDADA